MTKGRSFTYRLVQKSGTTSPTDRAQNPWPADIGRVGFFSVPADLGSDAMLRRFLPNR